jgi:hypothetical protein
VITFLAIAGSNSSFAQSTDDYRYGKFSLLSFDQDDNWDTDCCTEWSITFSDDTKGQLYYSKECGKYYIEDSLGGNAYYPDKTTALKALYVYERDLIGSYFMKGTVNCD